MSCWLVRVVGGDGWVRVPLRQEADVAVPPEVGSGAAEGGDVKAPDGLAQSETTTAA